ncbi:MAG: redoxin domain-containing protein [Flavobacteriia bacterium]|nr:redoxin domain-containing protein [Flavobacteriia bacterium]
MKSSIVISLLFLSNLFYAQKVKFKINQTKDSTVFLVRYQGSGMYYADTAEMKNGVAEFNLSNQFPKVPSGVLALLLPGKKYFDFIYNNNEKEIFIETNDPDFVQQMLVKKSDENKIFNDYVKHITSQRSKANEISKQREKFAKTDPAYKKLSEEIDLISKGVVEYQNNLVKSNPDKLVAKIVKMSMDIQIPESPKDANGKVIDSLFGYKYYRDHYFDNIDLLDDRLLNTPMFHNKLDEYFSKKMLIQQPDTIVKYAYIFCDKLNQTSEIFKYCVTHVTSTYEKSNIIGMDKVFVRMGQRYYCAKNSEGKNIAYWMAEDKLETLCDKVEVNKNLIQGVVPPNVILRDTTDVNWKGFYDIKADYTIVYFWDPDCGHCKTSTPKLQKLYSEKLKARNVEVFAVAKATGEEFGKWKKFIKEKNLTFINVGLTENLYKAAQQDARQFIPKYTTIQSLNYQETYDIFSTPRVFLLDKDKKLIAKQLSISQLEDYLDHLQGYKGAKIIEEDKKEEEKH